VPVSLPPIPARAIRIEVRRRAPCERELAASAAHEWRCCCASSEVIESMRPGSRSRPLDMRAASTGAWPRAGCFAKRVLITPTLHQQTREPHEGAFAYGFGLCCARESSTRQLHPRRCEA